MKIAVIGIGHMGSAIVEGLKQNPDNEVIGENHVNPRVTKLAEKLNFKLVNTIQDVINLQPEVVIFTLPAKVTLQVAEKIQSLNAIFISAAAGVSYDSLVEVLPNRTIARIIPNTPVAVGAGTTGLFIPQKTADAEKATIVSIIKELGDVIEVSEDKLSIVGTVGGCGPAFVDVFLESLSEAGVLNGLDAKTATDLAISMVKGSAILADKTGKNPAQLREEVCSPGGTTIKGVAALEKAAFRYSVIDAVNKANEN